MVSYLAYQSNLGQGHLLLENGRVRLLTLPGTPEADFWRQVEARLKLRRADAAAGQDMSAARQVEDFLAGRSRGFSLDLDPPGTPFQKSVWDELRRVPYGGTASYGEIAARIGRPGAARAVGAACGANPVPLAIPCHRVIGAAGALTGFGGGLGLKEQLLALEKRQSGGDV